MKKWFENNFGIFITAVSILVGTTIGAGFLGLPYVASQAGFFVALAYIFVIGLLVLIVNLYLGEITLRTRGNHQLVGYAKIYLGNKGKHVMEFALVFEIFSAIIAYLIGLGESFSFLFFNDLGKTLLMGIVVGILMSALLWDGLRSLRKYEKLGVLLIIVLMIGIFVLLIPDVSVQNLVKFNSDNLFLPFGVVLFAMLSFTAIPQLNLVTKQKPGIIKKVLITGAFLSSLLYALFTLSTVGVYGIETPEVATIALGKVFVFLGILTIFTSYLALGNALIDNLRFDEKYSKFNAWFLTSVLPIVVFIIIQVYGIFSFTKVLSIGGIVSGGLLGVLILLMVSNAKKFGKRKPEYSMPYHWILTLILALVFVAGIVRELFF